MPTTAERARRLALAILRPIAAAARRVVTPPPPEPQDAFCRITQGPAQGCSLWLPVPTELSALIASGAYEAANVSVLARLVRPTDVCIDIGGHYGFYCVTFAALAARGCVHVFEPVASLASSIEASLKQSGITNATVHRLAVASRGGDMDFRCAAAAGGDNSMGHLVQYGGVASPEAQTQYAVFDQITVPTVAIDELAFEPDFIKIDAEGAESAILQGSIDTLKRKKPRLLIELHGIREALACQKLLTELGYRGFCIEDHGVTLASIWIHSTDDASHRLLESMECPPTSLPGPSLPGPSLPGPNLPGPSLPGSACRGD